MENIKTFFKKLYSQTIFIYFAELIVRVFNFFTTILTVKYLGKTSIGQISYINSIVFIASIFTDLGYAPIAVKLFAQDGKTNKKILYPAFTIKFFSSFLAMTALMGYGFFFMKNSDISLFLLLFFLAANLVISSLSFSHQFALQGLRLFQYVSIFKVISTAISFGALMITFKLYPDMVVVGGVIPLLASGLIFLCYYKLNKMLQFVDAGFTYSRKEIIDFFKLTSPFALVVIITLISQKVDIIILKKYTGYNEVGVYTLAYSIVNIVSIIPGVISMVTFPILASLYRNENNKIETTLFILTKYLLIISIPCTIILSFCGDWLVTIFFGKNHNDICEVLPLLAWILIPSFLYSVTSGLINASPKPEINTYIQAVIFFIYIILLFLIVPKKGILGVVYCLIFTQWGEMICKFIYIRMKLIKINYFSIFTGLFFVSAISIIPLFLHKNFIVLSAYIIMYFVGLYGIKYISKNEFAIFYEIAGTYGGENGRK